MHDQENRGIIGDDGGLRRFTPWLIALAVVLVAAGGGAGLMTIQGRDAAGDAPTVNPVAMGGYSYVDGKVTKVQTDPGGNLIAGGDFTPVSSATWDHTTTLNSAVTLTPINEYGNVAVQIVKAGTITAGVITFEVSLDGTNWQAIDMCPISGAGSTATHALSGASNAFQMFTGGFPNWRARLSTVIGAGDTGSVLVQAMASAAGSEPAVVISGTSTVAGGKSNNAAAPAGNNIGALIGIANASAPTYSEGDQVLASLDLAGNLRVATLANQASAATTGSNITLVGGAVTTAAPTYTNGQADPLSLTATGLLRVDGSGVTNTVQGTADDAASATGNPVMVGSIVVADGAFTGLTAGNVRRLNEDTQGRLFVRDYGQNIFYGDTGTAVVTSATQMLGLSGSGLSYYVTDIVISNGATAQTVQLISSTTAGNACATSPANVGPPYSLATNGGVAQAFKTPRKVAANSAICCSPGGSTAFSCEVHGFIAP